MAGCREPAGPADAMAPAVQTPTAAAPATAAPVTGPERRILAFGNSLFAGYNLQPGESYPERLQEALRRRGLNVRVIGAGVSGDTTAAGRARLGFVLDAQERRPDLFILELGGNDLLRGLPPEQTRANLSAMLSELRRRGIPVLLMGMRAPPNLGADYVAQFDAIYADLAREHGAALVPFFLESIYDQPQLIQPDRIHPTAQGIDALVAATVDDVAAALPPTPAEAR
ncbi:arylesterase [Erythrobacteraceae bacterium CFH 75059]|nr:arylesterase [Erythrobacteraceae bacterium CFH 75059]